MARSAAANGCGTLRTGRRSTSPKIRISRGQGNLPRAGRWASRRVHARSDAAEAPSMGTNVDELQKERNERLQALREAEERYEQAEFNLWEGLKEVGHPSMKSYGFYSQPGAVYYDTQNRATTPPNVLRLAIANFQREGDALKRWFKGQNSQVEFQGEEAIIQPPPNEDTKQSRELAAKLNRLTLDNANIWRRENSREPVQSPLLIKIPYFILCTALDWLFENRPIQRFWFLETVARMPYFSYVTMLHLYETLGWWRIGAHVKRTHFAEESNEFHHLLIMESLGGDQRWRDRFLAQHAAVVYYWILIALWLVSPAWAYNFSERIEAHAVDTYQTFLDENADLLQELPAPLVAQLYYTGGDLYMFDEFQSERPRRSRRPTANNLYEVFRNIADDEYEHVKTMRACQEGISPVLSIPRGKQIIFAAAIGSALAASFVLLQ